MTDVTLTTDNDLYPAAPKPDSDYTSDDKIFGLKGNDTISSGKGEDTIYGGSGCDSINGDSGDDKLYSGKGNDVAWGSAGNDTIYGGSGADTIYGGSGNDLIYGDRGNHAGEGGDDCGGKGKNKASGDHLEGGSGDDTIFGGKGDDYILGGANNDVLRGNQGCDTINGGSGEDCLNGGQGSDVIITGSGNDIVFTGGGANQQDTISSNGGSDLFYFQGAWGKALITDFDANPGSTAVNEAGQDHIGLHTGSTWTVTYGDFVSGYDGRLDAKITVDGSPNKVILLADVDGVGTNSIDATDFTFF